MSNSKSAAGQPSAKDQTGTQKLSSSAEKDPKGRIKFDKESWKKGKELLSFLRPYIWHFVAGLFFLTAGSSVFMVLPMAAGELINIVSGKTNYGLTLADIGWLFVLVLTVQGVSSYLRVWLFTQISEGGLTAIRKKLYEKLITQRIEYLEQQRIGELTSRSAGDVQQLQDTISVTLAEFIRQIIVLVIGLVIIVYTAPKLTLVMLLTFPVVIVVALVFGRYIRKLSRERQDELAKTNVILEETLQAVTMVKAFSNESYETARYNKALDLVMAISMRFARIRGLFIVFIITVLFGAMFFVLWSGAQMVQAGEIAAGDLVTFITITALVGGAMASLGDFYTQILKAIGASERIMEILTQPTEIDLAKTVENTAENRLTTFGDLEFREVRFRYPARKDMEILKGLSFSVKVGQKVAIVGASGAGKSTIIQLLLRFYAIEQGQGQILLANRSIYDYPLEQVRQNMAFVPQDIVLFGGSILENIRYGRQNATDAEIQAAAEQANAWEFIKSFPEGLQTLVGERGVKLSGGQRQRIAIARAILKNPNLLLLDEATSALDAESEQVVQEALDRLMENRTAIIIAHRLATIKQADKILVVHQGQIVEQGTHNELLTIPDGIYRQLATLQSTNAAILQG
jgi:ABC-type multidrug transport system fused ATPase/permease subunit